MKPLTFEDWFEGQLKIDWLKGLITEYEREHDWDADEDPSATWEMLGECSAIYARLKAELGDPPAQPELAAAAADPEIPF